MQVVRSPVLLLAIAFACSSCATPRPQFTQSEQAVAAVPGFDSVRTWADGTLADFRRDGFRPPGTKGKALRMLALSGGGAGGAFGAGLLTGWSAMGGRPQFDLVSGVSIGALIAPFAFVGPSYDDELTFLFTSGVTDSLMQRKSLPAGLLGSGLYESKPLHDLVSTYVDDTLLRRIADEHRKGRRLYVVTMNLDAGRGVIWNLGRIAASGSVGSLSLVQQILIASASVPPAFAPVPIAVQAGGRRIEELHADGGPATQVFTVPEAFFADGAPLRRPGSKEIELYAIVNNTLTADFEMTTNTTLGVGKRAIGVMIKAQTRVAIEATVAAARLANVKFRVASIDEAIPFDSARPFDVRYMRRLYKLGFERSKTGKLWDDGPGRSSVSVEMPDQVR